MNIKNIKHFFSNKHFSLTREGLDDLKNKLDVLRKERFNICNHLRDMDSKEKVEYILANDVIKMLKINEEEVMKIEELLLNADVVTSEKNPTDVKIGSIVDLQVEDKTSKYTLVSTIEADPSKNMISEHSPLGKALLGKKKHQTVQLVTPKGLRRNYRILSIG